RTPWPACLPGTPASPAVGHIHPFVVQAFKLGRLGCQRTAGRFIRVEETIGRALPIQLQRRSGKGAGGGGRSSGKKRRQCAQTGERGLGRGGGVGASRGRGGGVRASRGRGGGVRASSARGGAGAGNLGASLHRAAGRT